MVRELILRGGEIALVDEIDFAARDAMALEIYGEFARLNLGPPR